jgi:hypothetical protein
MYHINSSPDCKTNCTYVVRLLVTTVVGVIIYKKVKFTPIQSVTTLQYIFTDIRYSCWRARPPAGALHDALSSDYSTLQASFAVTMRCACCSLSAVGFVSLHGQSDGAYVLVSLCLGPV